MSKKATRAVVSAVVVVAALGFLFYTTAKEDAQYYKLVDEVMVDPAPWYGKALQLHGFVVDGSWERRPDSLDHRFEIRNGAHVVRASYTGVVPDTFKGGAEVVLTGRLGPDGFHVEPGGVMAKCPSKYEAK
jgi:cytochrome c-type biogenesis protein CcmE